MLMNLVQLSKESVMNLPSASIGELGMICHCLAVIASKHVSADSARQASMPSKIQLASKLAGEQTS